MKVGDLVRLAQENVGYNAHLFDEIMLVTEIIDELVLPDDIGVAIDGMAFITPVHVGAVVSCYCDVIDIGRSSIRIMVEVWINSPHDGEPIKVTEGEFVFVAIDEQRRTRTINPE